MTERLYLSSPHMGGSEIENIHHVFDTNWIAPTGPMVTRFEDMLAERTGFRHVAALASGTAALHLALRLCGLGPGDAVWAPTMTFIGGIAPVLYVGATPVFLDVNGDDFLIDVDLLAAELERAASDGTLPKVVITTDLYGHVVDGQRLRALADAYGFIWISDAAEAMGAYRDGAHAGNGADLAIYSFNGNKIITTSGGGALASDNAELIAEARYLSTQAREPAAHYEHVTYGYNYRLSNVLAAIGTGQLDVLDARVDARRRVNDRYREALGDCPGLHFSPEAAGMRANRWLTTVQIDPTLAGFDRETARLAMEALNIESRPLWKPMHLQPLFGDAAYLGGTRAERAFEIGLCLPSGSNMSASDQDRVIAVLKELASRA